MTNTLTIGKETHIFEYIRLNVMKFLVRKEEISCDKRNTTNYVSTCATSWIWRSLYILLKFIACIEESAVKEGLGLWITLGCWCFCVKENMARGAAYFSWPWNHNWSYCSKDILVGSLSASLPSANNKHLQLGWVHLSNSSLEDGITSL